MPAACTTPDSSKNFLHSFLQGGREVRGDKKLEFPLRELCELCGENLMV